ncbi:MAG: Two-component response regulator [Microgenomates bacterium 39_7]|nr:MAG: Two-component response regulator [Microgenomates bacterium 39_7]
MRLLLVDDNPEQIAQIKSHLVRHFILDFSPTVDEAIINANVNSYHLIIVSLGVDNCRGLQLIKQLRADEVLSPILAITHHCSSLDAAHILNCGGDSIISKPFCWSELQARIGALIRQRMPNSSNQLTIGPFTLTHDTHYLSYKDQPLILQRKNRMIFECLMMHYPSVVTRPMLYTNVWEKDWINENNVDVQVSYLRKCLREQINLNPIITTHGLGYRLVVEENIKKQK